MPDFQRLSENVDDSTYKDIFKIIANRQATSGLTNDSLKPSPLSPDQITEIQALTLQRVRDNMTMDSGTFQSLSDVRDGLVAPIVKTLAKNLTADAFYNPVTAVGTSLDPSYYNTADVPISMSPQEATSYYSSGGVAGVIIDIKAGGMLVNGYRFLGNGWKPEWLEQLKDYADSLNFDQYIRDGNRDGLLYGGALVVPALRGDNARTYSMGIEDLVKTGVLTKGSLKRFWTADRWNCVLVPDYNVSAEDYLDPKEIFVPITGYSVNTDRAAVIRPRMLPYWGTIRQMGWGISEMESWVRPMLGLQIAWAAVPQMIQQLSVVYGHLPMDAILQAGGINPAMALAEQVTAKLRKMSNVLPGIFNQSLELKTIERDFQYFPGLVNVLEDAVCSAAELSPSIVFGRDAKRGNGDDGDSTLKLAASIQKVANRIVPQYQNVLKVMVYSCFGPDSEQAKIAHAVRIDFDSPVVLTNEERNQAATSFSTVVTAMTGAGLQPGDALEIGKAFIPDIELPQDVLDKLAQVADMGLQDETSGDGFDGLLNTLRGDPVGTLTDKLNGTDATAQLHDKLTAEPGVETLMGKLGGGLKKMFSKKPTTDSDFVESEHPRGEDGKFGAGVSSDKQKIEQTSYEKRQSNNSSERKKKDASDYNSMISEKYPWIIDTPKEHKDAIYSYTGMDYRDINQSLMSGKLESVNFNQEEMNSTVKNIHDYINSNRVHEKVTLYRGLTLDRPLEVGDSLDCKGFSSFSYSDVEAQDGYNPIVLELDANPGDPIAPIGDLGYYKGEKTQMEFVLNNNNRLECVSSTNVGGVTVCKVRIVK